LIVITQLYKNKQLAQADTEHRKSLCFGYLALKYLSFSIQFIFWPTL